MATSGRQQISLRGLAIQYVAKHVPKLIGSMDSQGWFLSDHYFVDKVHTEYHQYGYFCFAELWSLQHRCNPYYRDPRLLKAALKAGDLAAKITDKNGLTLFSSQGYNWQRSHMGWRTYWLMQTYLRLQSQLGAQREKLWRSAIDRQLAGTLKSIDFRRKERDYCKDGNVHNLYMWSTLCLHRARTAFGRNDLGKIADAIFKETATAILPAGYWHENHGPVNVYDHVTASALAVYAEETQAPWAKAALCKNLEFHSQFTYPDGVPIETVDGRVRYTHYPMTILPASWGTFPEGRGFVRALIQASLKTPFGGGEQPHGPWLGFPFIGEAIRLLPDDVLPEERWRPQPAYKVKGAEACVVRNDAWTLSGAAICTPPHYEFRWHLARANLLSLYHARHGLILGGGNSKELEFSSIVVHEKDGAIRYVPDASKVTIRPDRRGVRLNLTYGKTVVAVELNVKGSAADLAWRVLKPGNAHRVFAQATFLPHMGDRLTWGKGASTKLGDARIALSDYELSGKKIESEPSAPAVGWKGIKLLLPAESFVRWPLEPYNTHRRDNRYPPYKRVLGVEVPVPVGKTTTLRIKVR